MVDAVPLVKMNQLVTVQLTQGSIQLTSVARAMENGAFGQTIKVKNEVTRDVFEIVVTGPQAGAMGGPSLAVAK
jgi:flagella basal body P-ring formation protein FlgA